MSVLPSLSFTSLTERADYGLETLPILLCTYLFLFSHPSRYIPSDRSVRLHDTDSAALSQGDKMGESEAERERIEMGRA